MALLSGRQSLLLLAILVITVFIYPLNFASLLVMRPNPVLASEHPQRAAAGLVLVGSLAAPAADGT